MNKKEIQEKLNNLPKPKYLYQRYKGELKKYIVEEDFYIQCKTGFTTPKDSILLGKTSENILDLIKKGDLIETDYYDELTIFQVDEVRVSNFNIIIFVDDFRLELTENNIKSILTKEQFEKGKFEV